MAAGAIGVQCGYGGQPDLSAAHGKAKQDILIFVHGDTYITAESLFRLAQGTADGALPETPILFA